jgi:EmrB/QacA subfamily drug resistance transporter
MRRAWPRTRSRSANQHECDRDGIALSATDATRRLVDGLQPVEVTDRSLVTVGSSGGIALIATAVLASTVGFLNASVINVAVPAIARDLHAGISSLQWTVTSYLLTVAALLLMSGGLADQFGRRRVLALGLFVMLAASALCAVAPSIGALIAARVAQGVGAAMVVPSSLALLNGTLRVSDRARAIGIWAGLATLGATIGPYAGGWLVDHATWRAVFLLNIPLILTGLLVLRYVPDTDVACRERSVDVVGGLLAVTGLGGLIYAFTAAPTSGWLSAHVLIASAVGVASLTALVPLERRSPAPMLQLSLFRSYEFDGINATTVLFYGALAAASYLFTLQCELELGYTPAQTGAALIPESAVFLAIALISGRLASRIGARRLMVAGILVVAVAFVWLSLVQQGDSYVAAILPGTLLWGVGDGLVAAPLTAAVLAAVDDTDLGQASAINNAAAWVGGVVAIAIVPLLIGGAERDGLAHALAHGYQPAMIAMAGLCAMGALVAGLFVSDDRVVGPALAPHPRTHACAPPRAVSAAAL